MLDLGWQEFFLIATIAVVVVGPKDLPNVIRTVVGWIRKVRSMARDFQGSIEEVAREAELDEIRKEAAKLTSQDFSKTVMDTVDPDRDLENALKDTRAAVEADGGEAENSMLNPNAATAGTGLEVTLKDDDEIKGWDAATVATPSNSIMQPEPISEDAGKPARKPRAKKTAKAEASGAVGKPARKSSAKSTTPKPKAANTKTVRAKTQDASKPALARKPRKPRSAPKARPETRTDTPVTEA